VVAGMPPSGALVQFEPAALAHDGIRILGSKLGSVRPAVDLPALVDLYLDGGLLLDELISAHFPLAAINDALGASARGEVLRAVITF
jgi:S-(hydroxymethyl)glutathione dehydrogenase / alcohol dehydrogenase